MGKEEVLAKFGVSCRQLTDRTAANHKCRIYFYRRPGWTVRESIPTMAIFSTFVQIETGAHPASCKMATGSVSGRYVIGAWRWPLIQTKAEAKEKGEQYFHFPSGT
jgi:hypothetical protein